MRKRLIGALIVGLTCLAPTAVFAYTRTPAGSPVSPGSVIHVNFNSVVSCNGTYECRLYLEPGHIGNDGGCIAGSSLADFTGVPNGTYTGFTWTQDSSGFDCTAVDDTGFITDGFEIGVSNPFWNGTASTTDIWGGLRDETSYLVFVTLGSVVLFGLTLLVGIHYGFIQISKYLTGKDF